MANVLKNNGKAKFLIAHNYLQSSGVFGFEGGTVFSLEHLQFINNTATAKGSTISLSASDGIVLSTKFIENRAFKSGNLLIYEDC